MRVWRWNGGGFQPADNRETRRGKGGRMVSQTDDFRCHFSYMKIRMIRRTMFSVIIDSFSVGRSRV